MADFVQIMKDWRRMCKAQEAIEKTDPCRVCPLANNGNDCCGIYEDNDGNDTRDYAHIEGVVARWAKGNPELVYPRWWEWLASIGAVTRKVKPDVASELIEIGLLDPIPADIAQKLGIEPKC